MEEVENKCEVNPSKKHMDKLVSTTIRDMVNAVNAKGISKEDIVTILREGEQIILLYYK